MISPFAVWFFWLHQPKLGDLVWEIFQDYRVGRGKFHLQSVSDHIQMFIARSDGGMEKLPHFWFGKMVPLWSFLTLLVLESKDIVYHVVVSRRASLGGMVWEKTCHCLYLFVFYLRSHLHGILSVKISAWQKNSPSGSASQHQKDGCLISERKNHQILQPSTKKSSFCTTFLALRRAMNQVRAIISMIDCGWPPGAIHPPTEPHQFWSLPGYWRCRPGMFPNFPHF